LILRFDQLLVTENCTKSLQCKQLCLCQLDDSKGNKRRELVISCHCKQFNQHKFNHQRHYRRQVREGWQVTPLSSTLPFCPAHNVG